MANKVIDRYEPETGYRVGQPVLIKQNADYFRGRTGRVVGFALPWKMPAPAVRVRLSNWTKHALSFPVTAVQPITQVTKTK